jgi:hypothetical protein
MRDILFPGNPNCPVASFESYISKLNPKCEAIWQRPKDFVYEGDNVGKHLLGLMMTNIAKRGQLSRHYTNHSIRATSIVIMDESGFESRHIMKVSGHKSEASLKSYVQNIPNKKKIEISECLSNSLGQSAVGSNTKINIKETDQLDVFNGPFDLEPLSNSQLQNTISDLQSSPALPQQIPLGDVTNRNTAISKNTVMPFHDKMVYFQPRFAENCVVNINFNYYKYNFAAPQ